MNAIPLVLSLSNKLLDVGALAAFAALVGIAALALLIFSQARELKTLRDWADGAPERAAELEKRVNADAAMRIQRAVKAIAAVPRPAPLLASRPALPAGPVPAAQTAPGPPAATLGLTVPSPGTTDGTLIEQPKVGEEVLKEAQTTNGAEGEPSKTVPATVAAVAAASSAGLTATRAVPPPSPVPVTPALATPAPVPATGVPATPAPATPAPATPSPVPATPVPAASAATPPAAKPDTPPAVRPTLPPRPPAPVRPPRTPPPGGAGRERVGAAAGYRFLRDEAPEPRRGRALIAGGVAVAALLLVVVLVTTVFGGGSNGPEKGGAKGSSQANSTPSTRHSRGTGGGANPGPSPAQTHVVVLNSTETSGLAHKLAGSLRQDGYTLAAPLSAKPPSARSTSVVEYSSGHRAEAVSVGKRLGIGETAPLEEAITPLVGGATVVVIAGTDQAGGGAAGETPAGGAAGAGEAQGAGTGAGAGEAPAGGEAAGGAG
jgi:LytR cell envelope-related transcriptional attenuator